MKKLILSVWVLFAVAVVSVLVMIFYPYNPLRIDGMIVNKSQVCRGGELCFRFVGEKYRPVPVEVLIELADGYRYEIMKYTSNMPPGKEFKQRCFIVPYHVKPGAYQIVWSGVYKMNAFNTTRYKAKSDWIQVGK